MTILQVVGTVVTTVMVARGYLRNLLPAQLEDYMLSVVRNLFGRFSNETTLVIDEYDGLVINEVYEAAEAYLDSKLNPNTRRFKISKPAKEKHFKITIEKDEQTIDVFNGEKFKWIWLCTKESRGFYNPRDMNSTSKSEVRSLELRFHRKNMDMVIESYLPYITNEAKMRKLEKRTIKIYTVDYENMRYHREIWQPVTFNHPSTFDTLAMDAEEKDTILSDLDRFLSRRDYYRRVGKAWKRGYLLYGPTGTGKSSLIPAIANKLNFDVYDLELSEVKKNSDLRRVLLAAENRSILVIEDIDCTIDLHDKLAKRNDVYAGFARHEEDNSKVTLSGLLNFVDGLWSSCGDERIIIFTTNHIEKLDPALLRPGRMDVHVHMSYCVFSGFKTLAYNYLGIKDHVLLGEIEDLLRTVKATSAEIAEELLKNDDDADDSLRGLVDFMHKRIEENERKKVDDDERNVEAKLKGNGESERTNIE